MASPEPRNAGPLWLWLLGLILLLVAVWILVDQLTEAEFTGGADAPPAAEVETEGEAETRRDALRIRPPAVRVPPHDAGERNRAI